MEQHYFASSMVEWQVDNDIDNLIRRMKAGGFGFTVYLVPLPIKAHYKIRSYQPVVDGVEPIYQHIVQ